MTGCWMEPPDTEAVWYPWQTLSDSLWFASVSSIGQLQLLFPRILWENKGTEIEFWVPQNFSVSHHKKQKMYCWPRLMMHFWGERIAANLRLCHDHLFLHPMWRKPDNFTVTCNDCAQWLRKSRNQCGEILSGQVAVADSRITVSNTTRLSQTPCASMGKHNTLRTAPAHVFQTLGLIASSGLHRFAPWNCPTNCQIGKTKQVPKLFGETIEFCWQVYFSWNICWFMWHLCPWIFQWSSVKVEHRLTDRRRRRGNKSNSLILVPAKDLWHPWSHFQRNCSVKMIISWMFIYILWEFGSSKKRFKLKLVSKWSVEN